jgi:Astacin (Peptidase family M12A)/Bacterial pre-peptidase C-terminal domain
MSTIPRVCFDRILPHELNRPAPVEGGRTRAALQISKRWPVGSTIRARFLGGTPQQQATVRQFAPEWTTHANLRLEFTTSPQAEIRIAFEDDGSWSYIGTDCLGIAANRATMNYGWLDQGVVLHEFGHALGLIHEHQNPVGGIQWNKPAVYRDLGGPPNNWPPEVVDNNMFRTYSVDQINGTSLDPKSIMLYSFPASWTLNGFSAEENSILSATDKEFIGSRGGYPGRTVGPAVIPVNGAKVEGNVGVPGEEDLYRFQADSAGEYRIETSGGTDVVVKLFGPDSQTALIAEDDDSGPGLNSRIVRTLQPGVYYVQVRHYNPSRGTGKYAVAVSR